MMFDEALTMYTYLTLLSVGLMEPTTELVHPKTTVIYKVRH
jgi:hypothetical protein